MQVTAVTRDEYQLSLDTLGQRYYYTQHSAFGRLKEADGNPVDYLLFHDEFGIHATALVVYYRYKRVLYWANCIYGPTLADPEDEAVFAEVLRALERHVFASPQNRTLRINPLLPASRYEDTTCVEQGVSARFEALLKRRGYKRNPREWYADMTVHPRHLYVKSLEGLDETNYTKSLAPTLRNRMKKAHKAGVRVRLLEEGELGLFNEMLESTFARMETIAEIRPELYRGYFEHFGKDCYFPLAYAYTEELLAGQDEQLAELEAERSKLDRQYAGRIDHEKYKTRCQNLDIARQSLLQAKQEVTELARTHGDTLLLNSGCFLVSGQDMIYLLGAGYRDMMFLNGAPAIHGYMMEMACRMGLRYYNLFGCSGLPEEENRVDAGVMQFKRTFRGDLEELIGTYTKSKLLLGWQG